MVFLWVSPQKWVMRFEQKGKFSPHYIEPWDIVERVGPLAYRLTLPPELAQIHNIFYARRIRLYRSNFSQELSTSIYGLAISLSMPNYKEMNFADKILKVGKNCDIPNPKHVLFCILAYFIIITHYIVILSVEILSVL